MKLNNSWNCFIGHSTAYLRKMVILLLLIIQMVLAFAEITTRLECIDSKLTATLEYVSVLRYKTVRTDPINYSCTLITQCSVDRLQRLNIQIRGWRGASSVAVYIPTKNRDQQLNDLNKLDSYLKNLEIDPLFNGFLTVSVLFGHESTPQLWNCKELHSPGMPLYPINALRNLAAAATGEQLDPTSYISPYLFYLDVDFVPSVGLSAWVDNQHSIGGRGDGSLHHLTHSGGLVVVPAFESTVTTSISSARSLQYLMDGVRSELIHPFHVKRYPAGHGNTNFDK